MIAALARHLSLRRAALVGLIALAGAAVASLPSPAAVPHATTGFAIVLVSVALWATAALPTHVTGLVFFALALGSGVAPPVALLSGFWSNAAGLVIGGFVIGAAAERSGLGRYVARGLMQPFQSSYPRLILGILIGTGALSFLVPSTMGRLAITLPIVLAAAEEAGYARAGNGYMGLIATVVAGNFLTSYAILPANLTNIIALGAVEGAYGAHLQYAKYLLMCGPVLGVIKGLIFWACVVKFLPAPAPALGSATAEPLPLSPAGRRLAILLGATILLWATDVVHGIKPGVIAVAAAVLCLLPPVALVGLRESFDLNKLTAILSLGAVLGVAAILTHSGAGALTAQAIETLVPLEGRSATFGFVAVSILTALIAVPATVVGCIAVMTPVLGNVAVSTGLATDIGVIAMLSGLQTILFPYQTVPVLVGLAMGRVSAASVLRLLVPLALIGLVTVLPLQVLWLRLLGYLP